MFLARLAMLRVLIPLTRGLLAPLRGRLAVPGARLAVRPVRPGAGPGLPPRVLSRPADGSRLAGSRLAGSASPAPASRARSAAAPGGWSDGTPRRTALWAPTAAARSTVRCVITGAASRTRRAVRPR